MKSEMCSFGARGSVHGAGPSASSRRAYYNMSSAYEDKVGFSTIALHHGHKLDTDNRARAVPIYQTTSFEFKSAEHGKQLFALAELGPI